MAINITQYTDVKHRLQELGCNVPSGFALLPINFETVNSAEEFRQTVDAATVKTLLRNAGLPLSDIFPAGKRPPYVRHHALEWVPPTLFISASLISQHSDYVAVALNVIVAYVSELLHGRGKGEMKLDIVVERTPERDYVKMSYKGPLREPEKLVKAVQDIIKDGR